jgi:hypothetical protein
VRSRPGTPAFSVKVVDLLGIERIEHPTAERDDAEVYAREAIEDGCRAATVIYARSGQVLSTWRPEDLML